MAIEKSLDQNYLLVANAVGILGCYVTICLCEQLRCSYLHGQKANLIVRFKWLFSIGLALGGVGMWCMHYISMASVSLRDTETGEKISFGYGSGLTFFSLGLCVLVVALGVGIACNDRMFAKSKAEILEMFIQDSHHLSMAEIKKIKDSQIIWLISTKKLWLLLLGGFLTGVGFCVTNYVGMFSWEFEKPIIIKYDPGLMVASLIVALISTPLGFWVLFRLLSIFPSIEWLRTISSIVFGISVCGINVLGLQSANFEYNSKGRTYSANNLPSDNLTALLLAAFIALWILAVVIFIDLRFINLKYRNLIISQIRKNGGDSRNGLKTSVMEQVWMEISGIKFKSSMHSLDQTVTTVKSKPISGIMKSPVSPRKKTYVIQEEFEEESVKQNHDFHEEMSQAMDQDIDLERGLENQFTDLNHSSDKLNITSSTN